MAFKRKGSPRVSHGFRKITVSLERRVNCQVVNQYELDAEGSGRVDRYKGQCAGRGFITR